MNTDPDKTSALINWPRPTNREELERFLGIGVIIDVLLKTTLR